MTTHDLTVQQAIVLSMLKAPDEEGGGFMSRNGSGIADLEFGQKVLGQLERAGLVESRALGLREKGWRLTEDGARALPYAQDVISGDWQRRRAQWESENLVYGVERGPNAGPLSPRQQRAWVQGYMLEQIKHMSFPASAPQEVLDNAQELTHWLERRLTPHNPFAPPPSPKPIPKP